MRVTYGLTVTPHQQDLAQRVQHLLDARVRYDRVEQPNMGNGPSIDFALHTRQPDLSVRLVVWQDRFDIYANEAEVRIDLADNDRYEEWADGILLVLSQLVAHPLRLRVRYPLMRWFAAEGQIWTSDGKAQGWSGHGLLPFLGKTHEREFQDWYVPPAFNVT